MPSRAEFQVKIDAMAEGASALVPVDLGVRGGSGGLQAQVDAVTEGVKADIPAEFNLGTAIGLQVKVAAVTQDVVADIPVEFYLKPGSVTAAKTELNALTADRTVDVGVNVEGAPAAFAKLKTLAAQSGLADFADVNVPQSKIRSQLMLIKKLIAQTGLSDYLSIDINTADLDRKLAELRSLTTQIPVTFDVGKLVLPPGQDLEIDVVLDSAAAQAALDALTAERMVRIRADLDDRSIDVAEEMLKIVTRDRTVKIRVDSSGLEGAGVAGAGVAGPGPTASAGSSMADFMRSVQMSAGEFRDASREMKQALSGMKLAKSSEGTPSSTTEDDLFAMKRYYEWSFKTIQDQLRGLSVGGAGSTQDNGVASIVSDIDSLINKVSDFTQQVTLFRGVNKPDEILGSVGSKTGQIIQDKGYTSAAVSEDVAKTFGTTLMKITAGPGVKALNRQSIALGDLPDDAHEFTFPRNQPFKVLKDQIIEGVRNIHLEALPVTVEPVMDKAAEAAVKQEMTRIFRVEHAETGRGPYAGSPGVSETAPSTHNARDWEHPPVWEDSLLGNIVSEDKAIKLFSEGARSAFEDMKQLNTWFDEWLPKLKELGFVVRSFDVPSKDVFKGATQVLYKPENAVPVPDKSVAEIMKSMKMEFTPDINKDPIEAQLAAIKAKYRNTKIPVELDTEKIISEATAAVTEVKDLFHATNAKLDVGDIINPGRSGLAWANEKPNAANLLGRYTYQVAPVNPADNAPHASAYPSSGSYASKTGYKIIATVSVRPAADYLEDLDDDLDKAKKAASAWAAANPIVEQIKTDTTVITPEVAKVVAVADAEIAAHPVEMKAKFSEAEIQAEMARITQSRTIPVKANMADFMKSVQMSVGREEYKPVAGGIPELIAAGLSEKQADMVMKARLKKAAQEAAAAAAASVPFTADTSKVMPEVATAVTAAVAEVKANPVEIPVDLGPSIEESETALTGFADKVRTTMKGAGDATAEAITVPLTKAQKKFFDTYRTEVEDANLAAAQALGAQWSSTKLTVPVEAVPDINEFLAAFESSALMRKVQEKFQAALTAAKPVVTPELNTAPAMAECTALDKAIEAEKPEVSITADTAPAMTEVMALDKLIMTTIRSMATAGGDRPGGYINLTDLRAALSGVKNLDAALVQLYRDQKVNLVPQHNQQTLTDLQRQQAMFVGGEYKHRVSSQEFIQPKVDLGPATAEVAALDAKISKPVEVPVEPKMSEAARDKLYQDMMMTAAKARVGEVMKPVAVPLTVNKEAATREFRTAIENGSKEAATAAKAAFNQADTPVVTPKLDEKPALAEAAALDEKIATEKPKITPEVNLAPAMEKATAELVTWTEKVGTGKGFLQEYQRVTAAADTSITLQISKWGKLKNTVETTAAEVERVRAIYAKGYGESSQGGVRGYADKGYTVTTAAIGGMAAAEYLAAAAEKVQEKAADAAADSTGGLGATMAATAAQAAKSAKAFEPLNTIIPADMIAKLKELDAATSDLGEKAGYSAAQAMILRIEQSKLSNEMKQSTVDLMSQAAAADTVIRMVTLLSQAEKELKRVKAAHTASGAAGGADQQKTWDDLARKMTKDWNDLSKLQASANKDNLKFDADQRKAWDDLARKMTKDWNDLGKLQEAALKEYQKFLAPQTAAANIDITEAMNKLFMLDAESKKIKETLISLATHVDSDSAKRVLADIAVEAIRLQDELKDIASIDLSKATAGDIARVKDLASAYGRLRSVMATTMAGSAGGGKGGGGGGVLAAAAAGAAGAAGGGGITPFLTKGAGGWFGWMQQQVQAFNGAAKSVKLWHIAMELAVEIFAVWIPALATLALGLGGFALAAKDAVTQVTTYVKNLGTVTTAMGTQMNFMVVSAGGSLQKLGAQAGGVTTKVSSLGNSFSALQDQVRPQVFELYGSALTAMASKSGGVMQKLITDTGTALDRTAARIAVDMNKASSGTGLSNFIKMGQRDIAGLATAFANLGALLGALAGITQRTHIAEIMLGIGVAVTKLFRVVADFIHTPFGGALAAWAIGLHALYAWSGLAATALLNLVERLGIGLAAAKGWAVVGPMFEALGGRIARFGEVLKGLGPAAVSGAIFIAAALAAVVVWAVKAQDAMQKYASAQIAAVANSTPITMLSTTENSLKNVTAAWRQAVASGSADARTLGQSRQQLLGDFTLESERLVQISKLYGISLPAAMQLAQTAGVKVSDFTNADNKAWATSMQMIASLVTGYLNMGQTMGMVGSDMNVLSVTANDQVTAINNLTSAWDTWYGIVTGTQTSMATFGQSMKTFNTDIASGTSTYDTVNTDFQSLLTNANSLVDANMKAGASGPQLTSSIADTGAAMVTAAGNNKTWQAEVVSWVQRAAPYVTTFQQATNWISQMGGSLTKLQGNQNAVTIGNSNLTGKAAALAHTLQSDLTPAQQALVGSTGKVQTALAKFTTDLGKGNKAAASKDRVQLLADLKSVGIYGPDAAKYVNDLANYTLNLGKATTAAKPGTSSFSDTIQSLRLNLKQIIDVVGIPLMHGLNLFAGWVKDISKNTAGKLFLESIAVTLAGIALLKFTGVTSLFKALSGSSLLGRLTGGLLGGKVDGSNAAALMRTAFEEGGTSAAAMIREALVSGGATVATEETAGAATGGKFGPPTGIPGARGTSDVVQGGELAAGGFFSRFGTWFKGLFGKAGGGAEGAGGEGLLRGAGGTALIAAIIGQVLGRVSNAVVGKPTQASNLATYNKTVPGWFQPIANLLFTRQGAANISVGGANAVTGFFTGHRTSDSGQGGPRDPNSVVGALGSSSKTIGGVFHTAWAGVFTGFQHDVADKIYDFFVGSKGSDLKGFLSNTLKLFDGFWSIIAQGFHNRFVHAIGDSFPHEMAVVFDGARHEGAHLWDDAISGLNGLVNRAIQEGAVIFDGMRHEGAHLWDEAISGLSGLVNNAIQEGAVIFDGMRHEGAHLWDEAISGLSGLVSTALQEGAVIFDGMRHEAAHLWDEAISGLAGLGNTLFNVINNALTGHHVHVSLPFGLSFEFTYAKGGHVPGSGSGDTVPALLTPGEFVINKNARKKLENKFGPDVLHKMNKFAAGGSVFDQFGAPGVTVPAGTYSATPASIAAAQKKAGVSPAKAAKAVSPAATGASGTPLVTGASILAGIYAQNKLTAATNKLTALMAQGPATTAQKKAAQSGLTGANASAAAAQLNLNKLLASGTATSAQLAAAHKTLNNAQAGAVAQMTNLNKVYGQHKATQAQLLAAANAQAAAQNAQNRLNNAGVSAVNTAANKAGAALTGAATTAAGTTTGAATTAAGITTGAATTAAATITTATTPKPAPPKPNQPGHVTRGGYVPPTDSRGRPAVDQPPHPGFTSPAGYVPARGPKGDMYSTPPGGGRSPVNLAAGYADITKPGTTGTPPDIGRALVTYTRDLNNNASAQKLVADRTALANSLVKDGLSTQAQATASVSKYTGVIQDQQHSQAQAVEYTKDMVATTPKAKAVIDNLTQAVASNNKTAIGTNQRKLIKILTDAHVPINQATASVKDLTGKIHAVPPSVKLSSAIARAGLTGLLQGLKLNQHKINEVNALKIHPGSDPRDVNKMLGLIGLNSTQIADVNKLKIKPGSDPGQVDALLHHLGLNSNQIAIINSTLIKPQVQQPPPIKPTVQQPPPLRIPITLVPDTMHLGKLGAAGLNALMYGLPGHAKGGHIGGTGHGDTVPAMLTPGEFVLTKTAAAHLKKMYGPGFLDGLNKYATGGSVGGGGAGHPAHAITLTSTGGGSAKHAELGDGGTGKLGKSVKKNLNDALGFVRGQFSNGLSRVFTKDLPASLDKSAASTRDKFAKPVQKTLTGHLGWQQNTFGTAMDKLYTKALPAVYDNSAQAASSRYDKPVRTTMAQHLNWQQGTFGTGISNLYTQAIPGVYNASAKTSSTQYDTPVRGIMTGHLAWQKSPFLSTMTTIYTSQVPQAFATGVSNVGGAWGRLTSVIKPPVNTSIGGLNNLVTGINSIGSWASVSGSIPKIATMARGGRLDGFGGGDSVPALLEPGEAVVDKMTVRKHASALKAMGVPGFAKGGVVGGGYVNPIPSSAGSSRIDQGVDFTGAGPVLAIGNGTILRTSEGGWGPPAGPSPGTFFTYRLNDGPKAGSVVYLAEGVPLVPGLKVGGSLTAGQVIGVMNGSSIETGFADPSGTHPLTQGGGLTAGGAEFWSFLKSLGTKQTPTNMGGSVAASGGVSTVPTGPDPSALGKLSAVGTDLLLQTSAGNAKAVVDLLKGTGNPAKGTGTRNLAGILSGMPPKLAQEAVAHIAKAGASALAGGVGTGPAGGATGSEMANGRELYNYLLTNLFGGQKFAAAGATASIWGESNWNPFAAGTGGRGLIGWTPAGTISDAAFKGGMKTQLPAIIEFVNSSGDQGVISQMKSTTSVLEAANLWGKGVERYGINDVHSTGLSLAASFMKSKGGLVYNVKAGDTLSGIAARFLGNAGDWAEIWDANRSVIGGNPNLLTVGERLGIPGMSGGHGGHQRNRKPGQKPKPKTPKQTLAGMEAALAADQRAETRYGNKMNYDLAHGLTGAYSADSVKAQNALFAAATEQANIKAYKAWMALTPLQKAQQTVQRDDLALTHAKDAVAAALANVESLGGTLSRFKGSKTSPAYRLELKNYQKAQAALFHAGQVEKGDQAAYNAAAKQVAQYQQNPGNDRYLRGLLAKLTRDQAAAAKAAAGMANDSKHHDDAGYFRDSKLYKGAEFAIGKDQLAIKHREAVLAAIPEQERAALVRQISSEEKKIAAAEKAANIAYGVAETDQRILGHDRKGSKKWKTDNWHYQRALRAYLNAGNRVTGDQGVLRGLEQKLGALPGGAGLQLPTANTPVLQLVRALTTNPMLKYLISGPGSVTPLGWAMQPELGDLMVANVFNPASWVGKSATQNGGLYAGMQANYDAAQLAVQQFLMDKGQTKALKLAGKATGIHGIDEHGRRFDQGGLVQPGLNLINNQTGAPEMLTPSRSGWISPRGHGDSRSSRPVSPDGMTAYERESLNEMRALRASMDANTAAVNRQGPAFSQALTGSAHRAASRGNYGGW